MKKRLNMGKSGESWSDIKKKIAKKTFLKFCQNIRHQARQEVLRDVIEKIEILIKEIPKPPFYWKEDHDIKIADVSKFQTLKLILSILQELKKK